MCHHDQMRPLQEMSEAGTFSLRNQKYPWPLEKSMYSGPVLNPVLYQNQKVDILAEHKPIQHKSNLFLPWSAFLLTRGASVFSR